MADQPEKNISFEQLATLREKTEAISQFLLQQLTAHFETVRLLLSPRRLLGKHIRTGPKEDVVGEDIALKQLRAKFDEVCKPFGLQPDFDDSVLDLVDNRLELYPWEYSHEAKTAKESKAVTITSPLRWVLNYKSGCSLAQLSQMLAGKAERRSADIRQFVVNALVMEMLLAKFPGLPRLLNDLRYEVSTEKAAGLGDLLLVSIDSCVPSFRPSDDVIVTATRFSGIPAFIELIDGDAVHDLADPLKTRIEEMLR